MDELKAKLRTAVEALVKEGRELLVSETSKTLENPLKARTSRAKAKSLDLQALGQRYQAWYSKALPLVRQVLPDRLSEFVRQYEQEKRKNIRYETYTISDYLLGIDPPDWFMLEQITKPAEVFGIKFNHQITILESCATRFESILSDLRGALQAELFDDELAAAKSLERAGHLRAAGTLAGVALERHLASVAVNHNLVIAKKNATIGDFNERFKQEGLYDTAKYRKISFLSDIRNKSAHPRDAPPSKDEIVEMIAGVGIILKTLH